MPPVVRYADEELELFKIHIEQKINKAKNDLEFLLDQIQDVVDARDGDSDLMDDASNNSELEMLHTMAGRQRNLIRDLENALIRIRNKSYGICIVTGELIDKRRLLAVPITTKSLAAKNAPTTTEKKEKKQKNVHSKKSKPPVVISRIIRNKSPLTKTMGISDNDLFDDDDLFEDDIQDDMAFDDDLEGDLDQIPAEPDTSLTNVDVY